VRDPVMQDQLLAESEAAVPAKMVRELQVAGLTGLNGQPLDSSWPGLTRPSMMRCSGRNSTAVLAAKPHGLPGHRRAEARPFFERLCPATTVGRNSALNG